MIDAAMEAAFHGGLKLPNGVRPKVGRFDAGSVLVQIEWDPGATDDELTDAEDTILALIQHRRRERRRMAAAFTAPRPSGAEAGESDPSLIHPAVCRAASNSAELGEPGRTREVVL